LDGLNDATGVLDADEMSLVGTLPIPILDAAATGAEAATTDGDRSTATAGKVHQGQCVLIDSAVVPTRYSAFGGAGIEYDVVLENMDGEVAGEMFAVDQMTLEFSGHPNVLAGDYSYVLNASSGMDDAMQGQSRKWKLTVDDRDLPGDTTPANNDDEREHENLFGETADATGEAEPSEGDDAIVGDFGGRIPAGFMVALDNTTDAILTNVPRLRFEVDSDDAGVGLTLDAEIHSNVDVDVFWLGALAPNWMLELKVVGTSTVEGDTGIGDHNEVNLELYQMGNDTALMLGVAADPSYDVQIGGSMGGLTCANYYLKVSGGEGEYTLAWRLTHQATAAAGDADA
jgi:hypothetical protein